MAIKPFCVLSKDLTDDELHAMLEKCVDLGVSAYDWVSGYEGDVPFVYDKDEYKYWGVNWNGGTFASGDIKFHDYNLLTKDDAFNMLNLTDDIQAQKPKWEEAPEWANYLAMDENGAWCWYENEPSKNYDGEWYEHFGRSSYALNDHLINWKDSLESRPE